MSDEEQSTDETLPMAGMPALEEPAQGSRRRQSGSATPAAEPVAAERPSAPQDTLDAAFAEALVIARTAALGADRDGPPRLDPALITLTHVAGRLEAPDGALAVLRAPNRAEAYAAMSALLYSDAGDQTGVEWRVVSGHPAFDEAAPEAYAVTLRATIPRA